MVSPQEGARSLSLAREVIERTLRDGPIQDPAEWTRDLALPAVFDSRLGVFVTLRAKESRRLRGCIGIPEPIFPLRAALARAAFSAAFEDPRFPAVDRREIPGLAIEVSVLTTPEPVEVSPRSALPDALRVGVDGLIVRRGAVSGLLLPQVAPEQGWNPRQLLEATCEKAGLPPDSWASPSTRVLRFRSEIFTESD